MLLEKLVTGVREFLSPQQPNIILELDLAHCPGRRVEIQALTGEVIQLTIDDTVRVIDGVYVDNVSVDDYPEGRPVIIQRVLRLRESVTYADTRTGFTDGQYVTKKYLVRITVLY